MTLFTSIRATVLDMNLNCFTATTDRFSDKINEDW